MGEWSEFFEDCPEYAPAPPSKAELEHAAQKQVENEIRHMNSDAFTLIEETREKEKRHFLIAVESCPQCGEKQLNVYKLNQNQFLCECQLCLTHGSGADLSIALQDIVNAYGEDLNWKNGSLFKVLQSKATK